MVRHMLLAMMLGSAGLLTVPVMPLRAAEQTDAKEPKQMNAEEKFARKAAMGNLAEVEMGRLALKNATHEDVRQFAQKMIDDHTQANKDLQDAVQSKNITLPSDLDEKNKETINKLSKSQGEQFDRRYITHMVNDHEQDVKQYQKAAENLKDAELKAYAQKTLPVLQNHEKVAKAIDKTLNKTANDQ